MKPGQEAIYTIAGDNLDLLKKSPQLEGFRAKGVEVLLLTDPVDEFWAPAIGKYKDWSFKSATRGGADLAKIGGAEAEKKNGAEAAKSDPNAASLVAMFKLALGEAVKDVRLSERLTDSPVCLVADEGDLDIHLERMLRQHRQLDALSKRILEVNPRHPLVARLASQIGKDGASVVISEVAWVLLDQARIIEGESLPDPAAFSRRLSALLEKGLG
jgi:molecular chaperone HtpG